MTQKFYGNKGGIEIFYGVTKILQQQHDSKILRQKGWERLFIEKFYSNRQQDSKLLWQKERGRLFIEKFYGVTKNSTAW